MTDKIVYGDFIALAEVAAGLEDQTFMSLVEAWNIDPASYKAWVRLMVDLGIEDIIVRRKNSLVVLTTGISIGFETGYKIRLEQEMRERKAEE